MNEYVSPKQVARAIGVSEASLKRWCDKGLIATARTAGGHRRLTLAAVVEFLRATGRPLVRPEVIGLPATCGQSDVVLTRAVDRLREALEDGDEARVRAVLFDLYLANHNIDAIGDKVIAPAFHEIGCRWESGDCEVFQERRACEVCMRALYYLSAALPPAPANAPHAIGATLEGDWYSQAVTLAELTLRQIGWRAASLGSGLPVVTLCNALARTRPRLFWLSVSVLEDVDRFVENYDRLFDVAQAHGVAMVVGGKMLSAAVRQRIRYSAYCDTLSHLVTFAQSITSEPGPA
jgi:methanogenic corrinoid protein MtbC1